MKKEIMKNNWDFILYEVSNKKIITVVFHNSFIDISRSFYLIPEEEEYNFEELKVFSEHIRNNYDLYKVREIIPSI
jgi:hypothetical protein